MSSLNSGLSALRTAQFAIDALSNNIANANTPGYHRQNVHLESQLPSRSGQFQIGNGVQVSDVERVRSQVTEASLTFAISDYSGTNQLLEVESQIEAMFQSGDGSLSQRLDTFFAEITKLTSTSDSATQRSAVVQQGSELSNIFQNIAAQLSGLKTTVRHQIDREVEGLNGQLENLAELSNDISIRNAEVTPNRELDQRDALINQIAEAVDVSRQERNNLGLDLSFAGTSIQQGVTAVKFKASVDSTDRIELKFEQTVTESTVTFNSGRLPSLLEAYNDIIPDFEARLNELAQGVIQKFDQIHSTGVGVDGPFEILSGTRSVKNADVPLAIAGAAFPVDAGELYISVIDPSGNRKTSSISIDPETDSLSDIAAALSSIDNLEASVNPQTNQLQIVASSGFHFDFTGSVETSPDLDSFTGSSVPRLSGSYDGDFNDGFRFVVSGSGQVGVSDDLVAMVYDNGGALVGTLDIGNGYEAGSRIDVDDGVSVSFGGGTVADGDEFSSELVAVPDETGILASLGLNTFFEGVDADSISVNREILDNVDRFATGKTGEETDHATLFEFIELKDRRDLAGGRLSIQELVNEIQTDIGTDVKNRREVGIRLEALQTRYEQDRDSISGVDLNEELVKLQQFQRAYEAAAQVIQTADALFDELFQIIR